MAELIHLTILTGHTCESPRDEVADHVIARLQQQGKEACRRCGGVVTDAGDPEFGVKVLLNPLAPTILPQGSPLRSGEARRRQLERRILPELPTHFQ